MCNLGDSYYVLLIHTTHSGTYRERSSVVEVTQEWIFLEMQRKYNNTDVDFRDHPAPALTHAHKSTCMDQDPHLSNAATGRRDGSSPGRLSDHLLRAGCGEGARGELPGCWSHQHRSQACEPLSSV